MRILVVEDEGAIARPLLRLLEQAHHQVAWAQNLQEAWVAMEEGEPDLLVLDVMLPEGEEAGFAFAQAVREGGYNGPILFLTARDALEDRVRGLDLGGDDYLTKPFRLEEFMARVRALLRREARSKKTRVCQGPLEVDLADRTVRWWGRHVELAPKEFALLELFALHPHRIFTAQELWERFFPESTSDSIVRVYVRKLREKLGPGVIRTLPSGYTLGF